MLIFMIRKDEANGIRTDRVIFFSYTLLRLSRSERDLDEFTVNSINMWLTMWWWAHCLCARELNNDMNAKSETVGTFEKLPCWHCNETFGRNDKIRNIYTVIIINLNENIGVSTASKSKCIDVRLDWEDEWLKMWHTCDSSTPLISSYTFLEDNHKQNLMVGRYTSEIACQTCNKKKFRHH